MIEYIVGTRLVNGEWSVAIHLYRNGYYLCTCTNQAEAEQVAKRYEAAQ